MIAAIIVMLDFVYLFLLRELECQRGCAEEELSLEEICISYSVWHSAGYTFKMGTKDSHSM